MDTTLELGKVPFQEAIDFFKAKQPLPTQAYTDLLHAMHDRAFVIAGVTRQDILTDVQGLVQKALQEGTSLKEFQKGFKQAIEEKWVPTNAKGEENTAWRSRIIYETNTRQAYNAGRWRQLQSLKGTHPFWKYRHGDSRRPRPQHLGWDGLVLKADDPWWQSHYPQNDYGCRCFVDAVDDVDLEEMGKAGPDQAPPTVLQKVMYGGREIEVPVGVGPGFGYTPGASGAQGLLRSLSLGHPPLAAQAWTEIGQAAVREEAPAFRAWAEGVFSSKWGANQSRVVGFLEPELLDASQERGLEPASAAIEILDKDILHLLRPAKVREGKAVSKDALLRLPEVLESPSAVLYDKRHHNLVYAFDPEGEDRNGKFIVEVGLETKVQNGRRNTRKLNRVKTAGLVQRSDLTDSKTYELLRGTL